MNAPILAPTGPRPGAAGRTPLWAVLSLTWLMSFGTAIGWSGIYFIAERAEAFSAHQNLVLGIPAGIAYTLAAFFASSFHDTIRRRVPGLSSRAVLGLLLVGCAILAATPALARDPVSIWVFAIGYNALTGLVWPGVESFVSGGRRGMELRKTAGAFNIAWSSALFIAMWGMAPFMAAHPYWVLVGLAGVHVLSMSLLAWFTREPGGHGEIAPPHTPAERAELVRLRALFRACLVLSYVLLAGITPMLPQLMERLDIDFTRKPVYASAWMVSRVAVFFAMMQWHGWHGRRLTAAVAIALMIAGVTLTLGAPAPGALLLGLCVLGFGIGTAYAAAIYYAMEAGTAEVDAGGKHEAMIGLGYATGPLIGLGVAQLLGF